MEVKLQYPFDIEIDGVKKSFSTVTLRRPKARDMVAIGDQIAVLSDMADAGDAAAMKMSGAVFTAMISVVGALSDLGPAAGDLDFADLTNIGTKAVELLGEAAGSGGEAPAGA